MNTYRAIVTYTGTTNDGERIKLCEMLLLVTSNVSSATRYAQLWNDGQPILSPLERDMHANLRSLFAFFKDVTAVASVVCGGDA